MRIKAYEITGDRFLKALDPELIDRSWDRDEVCRWIDVSDFKSGDIQELLGRLEIELPRKIRESVRHAQEKPQVIPTENAIFVSMPVYFRSGVPVYLTSVCASTTIITIQHNPEPLLEEVAENCMEDRRLLSPNPVGVLFQVMDVGLRRIVPVVIELRADIEALADKLESETRASQKILDFKRRIHAMELVLEDQSFCLGEIEKHNSEALEIRSIRHLIKDLHLDGQQAFATLARMKSRIGDIFQHHHQVTEETTNRRLKILTILSAIYLPATLIAGIYGMNFENIPIQEIEHGYVIVMVIMAIVVIGQLSYFYWRGWFK